VGGFPEAITSEYLNNLIASEFLAVGIATALAIATGHTKVYNASTPCSVTTFTV
jgi:hypothetical protein